MSKPWVGYLAVGLLFISGVLEWIAGHPRLGIFVMCLSFVSLFLRMYIGRKSRGKDQDR